MRHFIPALQLVVSNFAIRDNTIVVLDVENGAWSLDQLEPETRQALQERFHADNRVYAVPRRHNIGSYNDVFAWFDDAPEQEKARYLVDIATLTKKEN